MALTSERRVPSSSFNIAAWASADGMVAGRADDARAASNTFAKATTPPQHLAVQIVGDFGRVLTSHFAVRLVQLFLSRVLGDSHLLFCRRNGEVIFFRIDDGYHIMDCFTVQR